MTRAIELAVALSGVLVLVAGTVWLLASPTWLSVEYGRSGFPDSEGFSAAERRAVATTSTLFIVRPSVDVEDLEALRRNGAPLYQAAEIRHLVDVKRLVTRLTAAALAGLFVLGSAVYWARGSASRRHGLLRGIELGGWLAVGLVVAIGFLAVVAWPVVFPLFHEVFFPPDTWQFPSESGLITLFPNRFWFDSALAMFAVIGVGGAGAAVTSRLLRRRGAG